MEINNFDEVVGVLPVNGSIVEGRFVVIVPQSISADFGSYADLPGVRLPATADEAAKATHVITFAVDNRPVPFFEPNPAYAYALRQGYDQAANVPFSATVYATHRGNQEGLTLASGQPALAYSDGTFTIPSGAFIDSASIRLPGAAIVVEYSGSDAGKPKYAAAEAVGVIGHTRAFDLTLFALTIDVE
jgi:hypothetical protein